MLSLNTPTMISHALGLPFGSDVVVISDTQYNEMKKTAAERQISRLEMKLASYEYSADKIRQRIASLKEANDIPPEASE